MYTQSRLSMLNNRETKKNEFAHTYTKRAKGKEKRKTERETFCNNTVIMISLYITLLFFFMCNGYEFANSNKEDDNNNKNISN